MIRELIILDEFIVTFRIPRNLPEKEVVAIRRTLDKPSFAEQIRRAIEARLPRSKEGRRAIASVSR